jgi:hypothetical protein
MAASKVAGRSRSGQKASSNSHSEAISSGWEVRAARVDKGPGPALGTTGPHGLCLWEFAQQPAGKCQ